MGRLYINILWLLLKKKSKTKHLMIINVAQRGMDF